MATGALLLLTSITTVLAAPPSPVGLSLPNATAGTRYVAQVALAQAGLAGCYAVSVPKIPQGLTVSPREACAVGRNRHLVIEVAGMLASRRYEVSTPEPIVIRTTPTTPGRATFNWTSTLEVLPSPYIVPSYTEASLIALYSGLTLDQVSCPQAFDCIVIGWSANAHMSPSPKPRRLYFKHTMSSVGGKVTSIPGGAFIAQLLTIKPLRLRFLDDALPAGLNSLVCPATSTCVIAGRSAGNWPWVGLLNTSTGTIRDSTFVFPKSKYASGQLTSLSCPSAALCVVAGSLQLTAAGRNNQTTVALAGDIPVAMNRPPRSAVWHQFTSSAELTSISCGTATDCEAVGNNDLILSSTDGGASWFRIHTMGCVSPIGKCQKAQEPFWDSVDGPMTFGALNANQCVPGVAFHCVVEWSAFQQFATTSDGRHWSTNIIADPLNTEPLAPEGGQPGIGPLSCAPDGYCFSAINSDFGTIGGTLSSVSIPETIPVHGNTEWALAGRANLPNNWNVGLNAISCPTRTSCVAVGGYTPPIGLHGTQITEPFVMSAKLALHPLIGAVPSLLSTLAPFVGLALSGLALMLLLTGFGLIPLAVIGGISEGINIFNMLHGNGTPLDALGVILTILPGVAIAQMSLGVEVFRLWQWALWPNAPKWLTR